MKLIQKVHIAKAQQNKKMLLLEKVLDPVGTFKG